MASVGQTQEPIHSGRLCGIRKSELFKKNTADPRTESRVALSNPGLCTMLVAGGATTYEAKNACHYEANSELLPKAKLLLSSSEP